MLKPIAVAIAVLAVAIATAGVASAQSATDNVKAKTKAIATTTGNYLSDAGITAKVKSKLVADSTVSGLKLGVETNNGVVTLDGTVTSAAERARALRIAKGTNGVRHVVNKIRIEHTAATTGKK